MFKEKNNGGKASLFLSQHFSLVDTRQQQKPSHNVFH